MPNRPELQNKGTGLHKNLTTGKAQGPGTSHEGVSREIRVTKRAEAENRNAASAPDKRRGFWRDRGFTRQSQAASLVTSTVAECNQRAAVQKQRAEDWPLLPEEVVKLIGGRDRIGKSYGDPASDSL